MEVREQTKRYGSTVAVDSLSFTVEPGLITGFLGPNGAGKSTTMRPVLGLDRPGAGTARVRGRPYRALRYPLFEVGALLPASWEAAKFLPANARYAMFTPGGGGTIRPAGPGMAGFSGYLVVLLAAAVVSFHRRDAWVDDHAPTW